MLLCVASGLTPELGSFGKQIEKPERISRKFSGTIMVKTTDAHTPHPHSCLVQGRGSFRKIVKTGQKLMIKKL